VCHFHRARSRPRRPNFVHTLYELTQQAKRNWIPSITNTGIHHLCDPSLLSSSHVAALSLGLNFIPVTTPHPSSADFVSYLVDQCHDFKRRIDVSYFFYRKNGPDTRPPDPLLAASKSSTWVPENAADYHPALLTYCENVKQQLISSVSSIDRRKSTYDTLYWNPPWLIPSLRAIRANPAVIVTLADKNMGIVAVNTADYIKEGNRQLSDLAAYRTVADMTRADVSLLFANMISLIRESDYLVDRSSPLPNKRTKEASYILQDHKSILTSCTTSSPLKSAAKFYLLMKMHKSPPAGRPIVSTIGSPTYFASKYVDYMLKPLLRHIPSYVESSQHLIHQLETTVFPDDCYICCADIESLYPNIPIDVGIDFVRCAINRMRSTVDEIDYHFRDNRTVDFVLKLLSFILHNNYFVFGSQWYHQLQGTAMGTPAAVPFACLFVYEVEHRVFQTTNMQPLLYKRYIDDIYLIVRCREEATTFFGAFNDKVVPTIRCGSITIDLSSGIFLDLETFKGPRFAVSGILDVKTYQKVQNRYLYLAPNSFHNRAVFTSTIVSELNRYRLTCNSDADFYNMRSLFYQRLVARGFNTIYLNSVFPFHHTRAHLLSLLAKRFSDASPTAQKAYKPGPKVFKTQLDMETIQVPFSRFTRLPTDIADDPSLLKFFGGRQPLTSYCNARTSHKIVGTAHKHLHKNDLTPLDA
jgi:hypothetical protein